MKKLLILGLTGTLAAGCGMCPEKSPTPGQCDSVSTKTVVAERRHVNSVYYWRTGFRMDQYEKDFLVKNQIGRMYIRFFDVVSSERPGKRKSAEPTATLFFQDIPPANLEIVPTVYITLEAMKNIAGDPTQDYAELIINRILTMVETNELKNVSEIQIDCDWTQSTRSEYFLLLKSMKTILDKRAPVSAAPPISLSATIRLHQLRQSPPPVDRGVLMCYNTGSIKSSATRNSIIDSDDIRPYADHLSGYGLPLDVAYPTFGWGVWFRGKEFLALIRQTDFSDITKYVPQDGGNNYKVVSEHYIGDKLLKVGDVVRVEMPHAEEIKYVRSIIHSNLRDKQYSTILYHLDSANLSKYTQDEISSFYGN